MDFRSKGTLPFRCDEGHLRFYAAIADALRLPSLVFILHDRRRRQPCPQIAKADGLIGLNGLLQFHDAERPAKRERQDDRTTRTEQAVKGLPLEEERNRA